MTMRIDRQDHQGVHGDHDGGGKNGGEKKALQKLEHEFKQLEQAMNKNNKKCGDNDQQNNNSLNEIADKIEKQLENMFG
jgi:hypothetical protein